MMSWTGYRQAAVPYHRDARHAGASGYTLVKLARLAVDGITSFSITPLRMATLLGVGTGVLSLAFAVYRSLRKFLRFWYGRAKLGNG